MHPYSISIQTQIRSRSLLLHTDLTLTSCALSPLTPAPNANPKQHTQRRDTQDSMHGTILSCGIAHLKCNRNDTHATHTRPNNSPFTQHPSRSAWGDNSAPDNLRLAWLCGTPSASESPLVTQPTYSMGARERRSSARAHRAQVRALIGRAQNRSPVGEHAVTINAGDDASRRGHSAQID